MAQPSTCLNCLLLDASEKRTGSFTERDDAEHLSQLQQVLLIDDHEASTVTKGIQEVGLLFFLQSVQESKQVSKELLC